MEIREVPEPKVRPGHLLIRTRASLISAGTERMVVEFTKKSLVGKAKARPDLVRKVIEKVRRDGIAATLRSVAARLDEPLPLGYSAAGIVEVVGQGAEGRFRVGQRVAVAGAGHANHAEINLVPDSLAAPIPDDVNDEEACFGTLAAIALHAIRNLSLELGDTAAVIGVGLIGQLAVQLLDLAGIRVIALDYDLGRLELARYGRAELAWNLADGDPARAVREITNGLGCDGVLIAAATSDSQPFVTAADIARDRARVCLVGHTGTELPYREFMAKELSVIVSRSYGPGRYDQRYEEKGLDYPLPFVRWTENRNMLEYLRMLKEKKVLVGPLLDSTYPLEQATNAFDSLKSEKGKPLLVLLSYPGLLDRAPLRKVSNPKSKALTSKKIRIALIGAGSFAQSTHLPNLRTLKKVFDLRCILTRTGYNAVALANQFGATYATTDLEEVRGDPEVDAVLIATRHNTHADLVLHALKAGKHVLVEKPLALKEVDLKSISQFFVDNVNSTPPILLTGFNRRFSPMAQRIKEILVQRSNPMIINYRMNVGHIPMDHWVHSEEGGGRNLGEACHLYDLFTFFTDSRVDKIQACSLKTSTEYYGKSDNFIVNILFKDGSLAHLTYTALGSKTFQKELMEIYCDGKVYLMEDYKKLEIYGSKAKPFKTTTQDKGHLNEMKEFASALKTGLWPIPWWQQKQVMEISLSVEKI